MNIVVTLFSCTGILIGGYLIGLLASLLMGPGILAGATAISRLVPVQIHRIIVSTVAMLSLSIAYSVEAVRIAQHLAVTLVPWLVWLTLGFVTLIPSLLSQLGRSKLEQSNGGGKSLYYRCHEFVSIATAAHFILLASTRSYHLQVISVEVALTGVAFFVLLLLASLSSLLMPVRTDTLDATNSSTGDTHATEAAVPVRDLYQLARDYASTVSVSEMINYPGIPHPLCEFEPHVFSDQVAAALGSWQAAATFCNSIGTEVLDRLIELAPLTQEDLAKIEDALKTVHRSMEDLAIAIARKSAVDQYSPQVDEEESDYTSGDAPNADIESVTPDVTDVSETRHPKLPCKSTGVWDGELRGADLSGLDLSGLAAFIAELPEANLSRTDLSNAFLVGANLTGADLTNAILAGADMTGAFVTGATLFGANLTNTNFTDADLRAADLTNALGLVQAQIDVAVIDHDTKLGRHLKNRHREQ